MKKPLLLQRYRVGGRADAFHQYHQSSDSGQQVLLGQRLLAGGIDDSGLVG